MRGNSRLRFTLIFCENFGHKKTKQEAGRLGVCLVFRVLDRAVSRVLNTGLPRQCSGREQRGWLNGSIKSAIARTSLSSIWIFAGIAKDFDCLGLSARAKPITHSLVDDDLEMILVTFYDGRQ